MDYVSCEPNSGCWLWDGSYDRKDYGQLRVARRGAGSLRPATHIALELAGRSVPVGKLVCHHCDVPACVNPGHLFIGTARDNTQDMMRKGRNSPPPIAKLGQGVKLICKRGHTRVITAAGRRLCVECRKVEKARRRALFVAAGLRCDGVPRKLETRP